MPDVSLVAKEGSLYFQLGANSACQEQWPRVAEASAGLSPLYLSTTTNL